ncbi:MAG: glycoside hydrolase family 3 C-terminal domain-containing protein [Lachnospiraceae bacterium]|nr:glycoside hydrolase family 3 C-terminal domain-containing protein [Lachnospiraceae bacterium]
MEKWIRPRYLINRPLYENKYVTACDEHIALSRKAAKEGMVLLKNKDHILPFKPGVKLALFGKATFDYVKGGGGSGDVYTKYSHNIYDGFKNLGVEIYEPLADEMRFYVEENYKRGALPGMMREFRLREEVISGAAAYTDTAVITFSRFSGEAWDRSEIEYDGEQFPFGDGESLPSQASKIFPKRDFYFSIEEELLIKTVTEKFKNVIVLLNIGGMMDLSPIEKNDKIKGALLMWQAGMEGGDAAAELIMGLDTPSGKLPDTFAAKLEDYPSTETFHESFDYVNYTDDIFVGYRYFETIPSAKDKVVYPFGFGLSYTTFDKKISEVLEKKDQILFKVQVTNSGSFKGKDVVSIYAAPPSGRLTKPARVLAGFTKTAELKPGETRLVNIIVNKRDLASFDDVGKVKLSAFVLEKGSYRFYLGGSVRDAKEIDFIYKESSNCVLEELSDALAPVSLPKRLTAEGSYETLKTGEERDINDSIFEKMDPAAEEMFMPADWVRPRYYAYAPTDPDRFPLDEVADGKHTVDEFLEQLDDEELIHLLGGQPNTGVAVTCGFGNLPELGIPNIMTSDGPAGVRIDEKCQTPTTAFPCATLLASTWNGDIVEAVGRAGGEELKENNMTLWLTPAVNIHRNPMCGRNFEYYSEDPLLAGKLAAKMVEGIQSNSVGACVKHFCVNNKETNRKNSDSRVSQRALREIYLKVFEIIIKESHPWSVMSSYNAVNGVRTSESKDLLTKILREEWGFDGMVTSDWWNHSDHYKEVIAGNDLKMATGFPKNVSIAMEYGELDRNDLIRCAKNIINLILKAQ